MPNVNTMIVITGIIAAASFGIVALIINSETKLNLRGKHNDIAILNHLWKNRAKTD